LTFALDALSWPPLSRLLARLEDIAEMPAIFAMAVTLSALRRRHYAIADTYDTTDATAIGLLTA